VSFLYPRIFVLIFRFIALFDRSRAARNTKRTGPFKSRIQIVEQFRFAGELDLNLIGICSGIGELENFVADPDWSCVNSSTTSTAEFGGPNIQKLSADITTVS